MRPNAIVSLSLCAALAAAAYLGCAVLRRGRAMALSAGVLALALAGAMLWAGQSVALFSDTPFHLSLIRATAERGLFPGDPFFRGLPTPLHYSLLHVAGAAFMRLGGSLESAWAAVGCLGLVLAWAVGHAVGGPLFGDARYGSLLALLFLLSAMLTGIVPLFSGTAMLLVVGVYPVLARAVSRGILGTAAATAAGALLGLALTVRLYEGFVGWLAVLLCCLTFVVRRAARVPPPAWLALIAAPAAVASPWLANALRQFGSAEACAPLSVGAAAGLYVPDLPMVLKEQFQHIPITPVRALNVALWFAGIGLALWGRLLPRSGAAVLRPVAALALALVFLPWRALLAAAGADSYRAGRMMEIVGRSLRVFPLELALCVAVAAVRPLAAAASSRWKPRAERALLALLLVFAVLGPAMRLRLKAEYGPMMRPRFKYVYAGKPAILGLPAGVTVLSDAWTSYMTQNALGCYCVTTPAGHSSSLVDVRERSRAIGLLFGGKLPAAEAGAFLRRHGGGYVLVNKRLASGAPIPNFEYKAAEYDGYRPENLDALPFVAKEYEDNDVALYRVVM